MNILIVDDNKNNRMILRLLLEDFVDEKENLQFFIEEAEDGQIAVEKAKTGAFDIILMDIMMPNMDGIEATKILRASYPKTMIIAVSAVDDSKRKKLILDCGAEDYIAKPVNADIFMSRISNYCALIESRTHKIHLPTSKNLFSKEVFSRHTNFIINTEDALAEFWEFFLLNARKKSDNLSDVVRSIFTIVEKQFALSHIDNMVFIEESDTKQYFTLINIGGLSENSIERILVKNAVKDSYLIQDGTISFVLDKVEQAEDIEVASRQTPKVKENIALQSSVELQVFEYMEDEDLSDLEEYATKLSSIMLLVSDGGVSEEEVRDIHTYLDRIASVLSTYAEVYTISNSLSALAITMSEYMQEFMDNSESLGPMCKAFSQDLMNWIEKSFHTGAPSIEFMNDTIAVNCQMISGMLSMNDTQTNTDEEFDDIFNF